MDALAGQHVALIKIDVEGFEPNVLAGARRLIESCRPPLWMEFNSVTLNIAQGYSPMAFARALFDCFEVQHIADGELRVVPGPVALVHDNITLHGSVEDLILRARAGAIIPDVEAMTIRAQYMQSSQRLRNAMAQTRAPAASQSSA